MKGGAKKGSAVKMGRPARQRAIRDVEREREQVDRYALVLEWALGARRAHARLCEDAAAKVVSFMNATGPELVVEANQRDLTRQTLISEEALAGFGLPDGQERAYERFRSEGASDCDALYLRNLRALFVVAARAYFGMVCSARDRFEEALLVCARQQRSPQEVLVKRLGLEGDLASVPLESLRMLVKLDANKPPHASLDTHRDAALRTAVEDIALWIREGRADGILRIGALSSAWLAAHLAEKDSRAESPVLDLMSRRGSEVLPWDLSEWTTDFDLAVGSADTADARSRDGVVGEAIAIVAWLTGRGRTTVADSYRGGERSNEPWIGHFSMRGGGRSSHPK